MASPQGRGSEESLVGKDWCSRCRTRGKTAYEMRISDWSSDVCSSDLVPGRRDQDFDVDVDTVNFGGAMRRGGGGEAVSFGDDRSSLRRSRGEVAARSVDGGRGRWPLHRSLRERSPSPWLRHREEFGGGPPPHASRREGLV